MKSNITGNQYITTLTALILMKEQLRVKFKYIVEMLKRLSNLMYSQNLSKGTLLLLKLHTKSSHFCKNQIK